MSKFDIDEALIRKLGSLLKETGLTELELEKDGQRIRVTSQAAPATVVHASPVANVTAPAAAAPAKAEAAKNALTSPMVGTAYLSSEPGGTPFVKVGDRVAKGQTVLIIEAMKVMNPISAPAAGVVKEVLVHDAQPVEFGEPLLVIE
ncbi:acetyl-CoA carboxylase biotin carboxyl carrier protein [Dongia sp.]|jgi:acetyl-CoA carboxylase biotin carboxyl carrier protein|uniref:acetyl-CoA carboxylase biotin carboxyl carrier protein n=1 Tax=Dongia sp. TaxID=1977262 RepID=UPI0035B1247E